ncbi:MAG: nuclear transport factor 2 family protein [Prolixibacteraceae bacterium]
MKRNILILLVFLLSEMSFSMQAQESTEKVKGEILQTLQHFNTAAQNSNTDQLMALFDKASTIMFIGGDSAEIWKGDDQIRGHLNSIFPGESVSLQMDRVDIDYNENTAWVFMDGYIAILTNKGEKFKAPYRFTAILVKRDDDWKFRLFNGSNPGGK